MISLRLEQFPPSVNHYWGANGKRRFLTKKAQLWKDYVTLVCIQNGITTPSNKPIKMRIEYHRGLGDVDNYLKGIQDAFNGFAYEDDKQICDLHIIRYKLKRKEKAHLIIEIDETEEL